MDKEIKYCKVIGVGPCLVGSDDRIICKVSEVPAMQQQVEELKRKLAWFEQFACKTCGGAGSVGTPPDDYYDCPDCVQPQEKKERETKALIDKQAEQIELMRKTLINIQGRLYMLDKGAMGMERMHGFQPWSIRDKTIDDITKALEATTTHKRYADF